MNNIFLSLSFFIVVQVQLSPFFPYPSPPTTQPHLPPLILPLFGFVHESFIHVPWWPFPFFPLLSPFPFPSGYCPFVLYFNVSGCILLACLFCWLGSTYRWDNRAFVFHWKKDLLILILPPKIACDIPPAAPTNRHRARSSMLMKPLLPQSAEAQLEGSAP